MMSMSSAKRPRRMARHLGAWLSTVAFCLLVAAPDAFAACAQADLLGTWRIYIRTSSDYLKCKIVTDATGKIIKAKSFCRDPNGVKFALSGNLTMSNTAECTVTGSLSFDGQTSDFTGVLDEATMGRGKLEIVGAGEFSNGVNFDFDGVKK